MGDGGGESQVQERAYGNERVACSNNYVIFLEWEGKGNGGEEGETLARGRQKLFSV